MTVKGITLIEGVQLTASLVMYYESENKRTRIDKVTVCNTTVGAITFDFHIIPKGGTAGVTNQIVDGKSVGAGETYLCPEAIGHWLEPGDFIQAVASGAAALTLIASGIEVT